MKEFILKFILIVLIIISISSISPYSYAQYNITPEINADQPPKPFGLSNDLTWSNNDIYSKLEGERIILKGRITDMHNVPISNAIITIWQEHGNHCSGSVYSHKTLCLDTKTISGTTTSNNSGQYNFITFIPSDIETHKSPYINIQIQHNEFVPFTTKIFIQNELSHISDADLLNLPISAQKKLIAKPVDFSKTTRDLSGVYKFDIILGGRNLYRQY